MLAPGSTYIDLQADPGRSLQAEGGCSLPSRGTQSESLPGCNAVCLSVCSCQRQCQSLWHRGVSEIRCCHAINCMAIWRQRHPLYSHECDVSTGLSVASTDTTLHHGICEAQEVAKASKKNTDALGTGHSHKQMRPRKWPPYVGLEPTTTRLKAWRSTD